MAFCDNCTCEDCQYGAVWLYHAQTDSETWICDVCYTYDLCTEKPGHNGPCETTSGKLDANCSHRPKLISKWIPFKDAVK